MPRGGPNSERILVLAPLGRDAEVAVELLREGLLTGEVYADVAHLSRELELGEVIGGFVLILSGAGYMG